MQYKLQDLIDLEQFQNLQDRLNEIYSFPSAIIDNAGNILTATAWQDICTQFHRKNKDCERDCLQSDQYIQMKIAAIDFHLHEANPAVSYRCPRGLVDNATPIIIEGIHYGNFFTGQFFLEKPDLDVFRAQAKQFGFDEDAYLAAVNKVPVWTQEQLNSYLFFIKGLIAVISESGLKKLKEIQARKQTEESAERADTILRQMHDGFWITNAPGGQIVDANKAMCRMLGYTREEMLTRGMSMADVEANPSASPELIAQRTQHILQAGSANFETRFRRKDGTLFDVEISVTYMPQRALFFSFHRDITERNRAKEELVRRADEFAALYETSQDIISQQDLPALLTTIVERATKLLATPNGFMYLYNATTNDLELAVDRGAMLPPGARLKMGEGLGGRVALTRQPLIVDDYTAWQDRAAQYAGIPVTAVLEVPMLYRGELLGVLGVSEVGTTTRKFTEADTRLLALFASQAAGAVHNARLLNETQQRANEFAALYKVTRDLTATQDAPALLDTIVQHATELFTTPNGTICLYDPARNDLMIAAVKGTELLPVGTRVKIGDGAAGIVAQTRAPLIVANYSQWEHRLTHYAENRFGAAATVPMLYGGKLIGTLNITEDGSAARQFTQADLRLLTLFAGLAAGAVHNARLLEETHARAEQLALLYDAGLTLNRTLEPRVQLEFLCTIATKALRAGNTAFFRYDAGRNDLGLEFGVGLIHELDTLRDVRFPLGAERGLIGWVAQQRVPLNLPDVTTDARWIDSDPAIRSALWVPVLHDEQLLGVLSASSTRVNAFTPQDERLLVLFANQVAVALENTRLFDETRQRLAELEAVNRISSALRAATTLDEMLPRLLDETLAVLNTNAGAIWLSEAHAELRQVVARGKFAQIRETPTEHGAGIAGWAFSTGAVTLAREFASDLRLHDSVRAKIPPGWGGACVPIRAADQIIGVFFVSVQLPRELTSGEVRLLTTLAEIAGNAIQRTRLNAQTQIRLEQVQALHAIDIAITGSADLNVTLNILLSQVAVQLSVDAAAILLLNPVTQTLEYAAGHGFRTRGIERSRVRLGEGDAGRAALERRMTHAPNLQEAGAAFTRAKLLSGEGFIGYYAVPLIAKAQVQGVLDVFQRAPLELEPEGLDFLQALATQAAIAIDSAHLFDALQRSNAELALAYDETIEGWSHALDLRDKETEGHTQRVTEITLRLASAMGINKQDLGHIRRGALLHDIGKMGVPDSILLKPGQLTDEEWKLMRLHPQLAYELLAPIAYLHSTLDVPYCHHEKWDGTGYPRGLKREQIPLAARIFAIVDVWDALTSDRPYRAAWSKDKAMAYVREQSGKHFDPQVVQMFLQEIADK